MADQKRTWITVLIVAFLVAGLSMIALVGGAAYWISSHVATEMTTNESAEAEFGRERARFAGQQPLLEVSGGDNPTFPRLANAGAAPRGEITILHARVYDPAVGKMVRADIPFWLIRTAKSLPFLPDMGSLTLEDLEQHGPGLIVNGQGNAGEQVLVWAE